MRYLFTLAFIALAGAVELGHAAREGGKVSPAGEEIHIDLPEELHRRNTSSRGQGCCVFTSIHHASLWQRIPQLEEFPKWLQKHGLTGGGYPGNVEERINKICKERGAQVPPYIQIFGAVEDDLRILEAATKSGRLPTVTYGISPTPGRYRGRIAHMVSLPHADLEKGEFCVLDNNFTGVAKYEWMNKAEFVRAYTSGGRSGWSVILLDHGPPPVPWTDGPAPLPPAPIAPKMPAPKPPRP